MLRRAVIAAAGLISLCATLFFLVTFVRPPAPVRRAALPFIYSFNVPGILLEAARASESTSPYWFLDSGGELHIREGEGRTIHGEQTPGDPWQRHYALTNPVDSDAGAHPQNIFRLVSRSLWDNTDAAFDFLIERDNLSASPNRNGSNGVLLMSRYQDAGTFYYAGVRVDGTAIIKKKYAGVYYTLAQSRVFAGRYDRVLRPSLLPHRAWMGIRVTTVTDAGGSVLLTLSFRQGDGEWETILSAHDDGSYGTPPITSPGAIGIRTDFMDVRFRTVRIADLAPHEG